MPRVKGGYEVLNLVAGPKEDVELEVDCFLSPSSSILKIGEDAKWLTSAIPLQKIPVQADGDRLKIWELYKVRTGIFQAQPYLPSQVNAEEPFNGPSQTGWGVGGLPLTGFSTANPQPGNPPFNNTEEPFALDGNENQTMKSWGFNPWMDNSKYFVSKTKGGGAYSTGDNNSTVILMSDEWGWGVMCPSGFCYLVSGDYMTKQVTADPPVEGVKFVYQTFPLPRYFTLYFRQRWVKSPVILMDLFEQMLNTKVSGFSGESGNIEEVQMGWGRSRAGPEGMMHPSGVASGYSSGTMMDTQDGGESSSNLTEDPHRPPIHPSVYKKPVIKPATTLPSGCEVHVKDLAGMKRTTKKK
ncbi:VP1 [black sea bass-associated polyomavirus 1]|uniref:VP1 n=1 Tax=black sea bass-associated polyomavirus 1 TaxID=2849508 RepID=A0A0A1C3W6_9POLY|nr:VP1 [Black sea bass polyomavirus 1]AIX88120.1 VP1 [Black sea bass polyomavirus 1]